MWKDTKKGIIINSIGLIMFRWGVPRCLEMICRFSKSWIQLSILPHFSSFTNKPSLHSISYSFFISKNTDTTVYLFDKAFLISVSKHIHNWIHCSILNPLWWGENVPSFSKQSVHYNSLHYISHMCCESYWSLISWYTLPWFPYW